MHEAFIFWGVPIFALILLADRKHLWTNVLMIISLLAVFAITCIFKGNIDVVNAINNSWNSVLDGEPLRCIMTNSIGALSWTTKYALVFHLKHNTAAGYSFIGITYWPLFWIATYYFISFFFRAYTPTKTIYGQKEQTRLSTLFITATICLLPMFCGLSCDYGRLFQYATVSTFAAYLIVSPMILDKILPKWVYAMSGNINMLMERLLYPQRGVLAILLLTIGISPCFFDFYQGFTQSPIGAICAAIPRGLHLIAKLII